MLPIQKKLTIINRTIAQNRRKDWIVVHYVGAVSTAENNVDYFFDKNRKSSAHYFVDEKEIWQCVDDSNIAWHVGGAKNYYNNCRNQNSIGVEMCCKKNEEGELYIDEQTVTNTIELVRYLMELYGIDSEHVVRHYDVTGKKCPAPFVDNEELWTDFQRRLIVPKEIKDLKVALDLLEEKGIVTDRKYWEKVLLTTRNVDHLMIKFANYIK
jgi:N-acetylmuramoyl-L-alanine amidase